MARRSFRRRFKQAFRFRQNFRSRRASRRAGRSRGFTYRKPIYKKPIFWVVAGLLVFVFMKLKAKIIPMVQNIFHKKG